MKDHNGIEIRVGNRVRIRMTGLKEQGRSGVVTGLERVGRECVVIRLDGDRHETPVFFPDMVVVLPK